MQSKNPCKRGIRKAVLALDLLTPNQYRGWIENLKKGKLE